MTVFIPIHLPNDLCNKFTSVIHEQNDGTNSGKINYHQDLSNILNSVEIKKHFACETSSSSTLATLYAVF